MPGSRDSLKSKAGVLVLGDYRQTLTIARSLAHANYRVTVGTAGQPFAHTRYCRYVSEHWHGPECRPAIRTNPSQEFVLAMLGFLEQRPDIKWIFPVGDTDLRTLCPHAGRLEAAVNLVMLDAKTIETCTVKTIANEKAEACGIPVPQNEIVHNRDELIKAVNAMGYPCIVKPVSERYEIEGEKVRILRAHSDLDKYFWKWPDNNARLIVQRFAEDRRHNCQFLADEGRLLAYFENIVLRTTRSNGTGYGTDCLSIPPLPKLREHCETLLMDLKYSGAGCVQFLVDDRSGIVSFLEINSRLDATCALAVHCGYDFPLMALEYARYRHGMKPAPPRNDSPYPRHRAVWLLGEIEGLGHELRRHHIGVREAWPAFRSTLRSAIRADVHLIWSWRDPLPALHAFARLLSSILFRRPAAPKAKKGNPL